MTYPEFRRSLLWDLTATLPTPDEWAYLCGGGCRTLFPWGDGLDRKMKLHHFESGEDQGKPYDMEQPNFFGLSIAYDPYKRELVDGKTLTTCAATAAAISAVAWGLCLDIYPVPLTVNRRFGRIMRFTMTMTFSVLLSGCRHPGGEWYHPKMRGDIDEKPIGAIIGRAIKTN